MVCPDILTIKGPHTLSSLIVRNTRFDLQLRYLSVIRTWFPIAKDEVLLSRSPLSALANRLLAPFDKRQFLA